MSPCLQFISLHRQVPTILGPWGGADGMILRHPYFNWDFKRLVAVYLYIYIYSVYIYIYIMIKNILVFFHSTADSLELCGRAKPATQSSQIEANTKQETKHHTKGDKQQHIGRKACLHLRLYTTQQLEVGSQAKTSWMNSLILAQ